VVERLARRDRQDPPPQVVGVPQARIGAQRRQERLLEAVVRVVRADGRVQETVDVGPVLLEEARERRQLIS
jgi:hypothetical protein